MKECIVAILQIEWRMFQGIRDIEGRASCQEDIHTFIAMRMSQFLTWDQATLESYLLDLQLAADGGGNLFQEKYARMLQHSDVDSYASIQHLLPAISPFKQELIEVIVRIQLNWQNEYARRYPSLAARSRPILTSHDDLAETSFESYLRGELHTYSDRTLTLYAKHLAKIRERGANITLSSMFFLAKISGFEDLDAMERAAHS